MDKDYIQRLKDMLADANKKIADTENIEDPTEKAFKKNMFLNSKKEIESLLKKAEADAKTKKAPVEKKATPKPATKPEAKVAKKEPTIKVEPKKATPKPEVKKAVKPVEVIDEPKEKVAEKQPEQIKKSKPQPALSDKQIKAMQKAAAEKAKQDAKRQKEADKEYKRSLKEASKMFKKPKEINGYLVPEYSDEVARVRRVDKISVYGAKKKSFSQTDLALSGLYSEVFEIWPYVETYRLEDLSVKPYKDKNYISVVPQYKDKKKTPTAKVGVEAGPLENGFVEIVKEEPKKETKVEEPKKVVEKPAKASKKVEAKKTEKVSAKPEVKKTPKAEKPVNPKVLARQQAKEEKLKAKEQKRLEKEKARLAQERQKEALERENEMKRKQEDDTLRNAKAAADKRAAEHESEVAQQKAKEAEINRLAQEASEKAAKQEKADLKKAEQAEAKAEKAEEKVAKDEKKLASKSANSKLTADEEKRIAEQSAKREQIQKGEFIKVELPPIPDEGVKSLKAIAKRQKQLTAKYSKKILDGAIVTTTDYKPDVSKHVIELHDVVKSYITGDVETPVLKGVNLTLNKGDFIVILGPSGSGKTTFLNTISGLDKATKGDVFVLGYNLSYLKDSHLTKFRRKHVGFIFQQYNLLTNLTARENAEVGENLAANKNSDMTIEDIFETIGMKEQMNKYPHQMSGGQQQRVSIARALAKNPDILFADEPTGALDEEMGRKVLEILVEVNKRYGTTVIVVTHNPNIAKIGNTVIHIRNGRVDEVEKNQTPEDPSTIEWA